MQRVELSIRQFPLSSFLCCSLFPLQLGRCVRSHFITFYSLLSSKSAACMDCRALLWSIFLLTVVQQGLSSDAGMCSLPILGGEGGRS